MSIFDILIGNSDQAKANAVAAQMEAMRREHYALSSRNLARQSNTEAKRPSAVERYREDIEKHTRQMTATSIPSTVRRMR